MDETTLPWITEPADKEGPFLLFAAPSLRKPTYGEKGHLVLPECTTAVDALTESFALRIFLVVGLASQRVDSRNEPQGVIAVHGFAPDGALLVTRFERVQFTGRTWTETLTVEIPVSGAGCYLLDVLLDGRFLTRVPFFVRVRSVGPAQH